jgi:hypothetical protein
MSLRAQSLKDIFTFTRATTATYFNSAGVLTTAAVDEPRIDYDPATLVCRGLLVEEERTNLILNSAVFATQSVTVAAVWHTLSFYGNGSIALTGVASPEVSLVGSGASTRVSLVFLPGAGSLTLTLTGVVWLAQLEVGPHATSYISTTSAPATRARDVCYTTTLEPWFNEAEGTIYCEYVLPYADHAADTAYRQIAAVVDGGGANRHISAFVYGGVRYSDTTTATVQVAGFDSGAFAANVVQKQAYAWAADDVAGIANGSALQTDTSAAMPTGLTTFLMGVSGGDPNGYIRKVKFYPRRLSNTELAALVA